MKFYFLIILLLLLVVVESKELNFRILENEIESIVNPLRVMVVCGIHGREYYTTKICNQIKQHRYLKYLLIDEANPEGAELARTNNSCWRGNANRIDLNRNWPHEYSRLSKKRHPIGDEQYPGETPFSEWETQSLKRILEFFNPDVLLSVHSGDLSILLPYDGKYATPQNHFLVKNLTRSAIHPKCNQCKIGSSMDVLGYQAIGTMNDYALTELKIPFVFTLETYINKSKYVNCFQRFNPPDDGTSQEYVASIWSNSLIPSLLEAIYYEYRQIGKRKRTFDLILNE